MSALSEAPGHDAQPAADRRAIRSWMLFDWAAQPFHTLIITFIFAPYFAAYVAPDPVQGQADWAMASTIGGLLIAFMAPIVGALSDATGPRKPWIFGFSVVAVIGSLSLWFAAPEPTSFNIALALVGFVVALIGFEFAAIFNNAMMPGLVGRDRLGSLSGNAWALGYAGGLVSLVLVMGFMAADPQSGRTFFGLEPILGLDPQRLEGERAAGPLTALWYIVFVIPLFAFTPDAPRRTGVANAVRKGLAQLVETIRGLPSHRSLLAFLASSMFYRDALNGVYAFGGIYVIGVMGWTTIQIGIFGILASVIAIAGSILAGCFDVRIGTKKVVAIAIVLLIATALGFVSIAPGEVFFVKVDADSPLPDVAIYGLVSVMGAAGGALQAASRPLLVDQVDHPERMGEAFGLYALSGRATAFLAPFGIWLFTELSGSQRIGITPVIGLFVIGLVLLIPVRSRT
ncbi:MULTISPECIES: MFS transporter [unclassified Roseitalea]|uniref:MFS transporter n=1 Tax=unclassified Roseitalea TaxID=2639107 RepID=UPI00273E0030|nr:MULTISPECIES: MFS transporter [unclassified Roseitalea]